jgi:hypothetical protein
VELRDGNNYNGGIITNKKFGTMKQKNTPPMHEGHKVKNRL